MLQLSKYVGIPFTMRGTETNGIDCYSLIKKVYLQERDIAIPYLFVPDDWEPVNSFIEWDMIALSRQSKFYEHVLLYIGDDYALHADDGLGYSRIEKVSDVIERYLPTHIGGFRWKKS